MFGMGRRALEDRVAVLESEVRRLKTEWLDMYEKLTRLYDRTRKRQERETEETVVETLADRKAALRAKVFGNGSR